METDISGWGSHRGILAIALGRCLGTSAVGESSDTPMKRQHFEPKNGGLQDDLPFQLGNFQV